MKEFGPLADEAVTRILFELGPRKLVLVEGETDRDIFSLWYSDKRDRILFLAARGLDSVEKLLKRVMDQGATRAFAITDRDFRSQAEVDAPKNDPSARLFILDRYEIENYLLEPEAIAEELRHNLGPTEAPTAVELARRLEEICRSLAILAAADVLLYGEQQKLLEIGFNLLTESDVLDQIEVRVRADRKSLHASLHHKLAEIQPTLDDLEASHRVIRGKRLLDRVRTWFQHGVRTTHLALLLTRAVKLTTCVHRDITSIVEGRILP